MEEQRLLSLCCAISEPWVWRLVFFLLLFIFYEKCSQCMDKQGRAKCRPNSWLHNLFMTMQLLEWYACIVFWVTVKKNKLCLTKAVISNQRIVIISVIGVDFQFHARTRIWVFASASCTTVTNDNLGYHKKDSCPTCVHASNVILSPLLRLLYSSTCAGDPDTILGGGATCLPLSASLNFVSFPPDSFH